MDRWSPGGLIGPVTDWARSQVREALSTRASRARERADEGWARGVADAEALGTAWALPEAPQWWQDMGREADALGPTYDRFGNPEGLGANAFQYLTRNPVDWPDVGGFDPNLTFGDVAAGHGFEGFRALAAEGAMGVLEPGPAEALGLLVGIPRRLQGMIARRINPLGVGPDRLPYQQYHGTDTAFDRAGTNLPPWEVDYHHHTTRTPRYAENYTYKGPLDVDSDLWGGPNIRMETTLLRRPRPQIGSPPLDARPGEVDRVARLIDDTLNTVVPSGGLTDQGTQRLHRALDRMRTSGKIDHESMTELHYSLMDGIDELVDQGMLNGYEGFDLRQNLLEEVYGAFDFDGYINLDIGSRTPFDHHGAIQGSGEFVTNDMRNVIRANHPEDAIRWLAAQPDLQPEELAELWRAANELGMTDLLYDALMGGQ